MDTNKTKKKWKELGIDALFDFAGAFLQAVGVWCFIEPSRIAPGGVSGIALMLNHLFALPIGAVSLVINIPLMIAAWCLLDRSMTLKTVRTVIWMSVIQDLVSMAGIWQYEGDRLISCGFGGIFVGVGMALIFMRNSTTGGGDILAKLLQKLCPYMQTGYAIMLVDFVIVGASVLVFGEIEAALYGIISIVCTTQAVDTLLYGMNKGSLITIHSEKNEEIAREIMETMDRGTTFYKSIGGYSGKEGLTLTCAVDRKQFHVVKEIIDRHDPRAFVIVSPSRIWELADMAKHYVSLGNQTGEGWFLTGEMLELIHSGVKNIVCTQPFGCLPNHIVGKGVIKELRASHPEANIIAVDYDPGASEVNQLNRIKLMLATAQKQLHIESNKAIS